VIHAAGVSHNKANVKYPSQRQELERMARAGTSEKRMVFRARLILECATGADNVEGYSGWDAEAQSAFELNADVIFNPCNGDTSAGRVPKLAFRLGLLSNDQARQMRSRRMRQMPSYLKARSHRWKKYGSCCFNRAKIPCEPIQTILAAVTRPGTK
jgi:hypothetical protein